MDRIWPQKNNVLHLPTSQVQENISRVHIYDTQGDRYGWNRQTHLLPVTMSVNKLWKNNTHLLQGAYNGTNIVRDNSTIKPMYTYKAPNYGKENEQRSFFSYHKQFKAIFRSVHHAKYM